MVKYILYDTEDNVVGEFSDLIDVYIHMDDSASITPLKEYFCQFLTNLETTKDFISKFEQEVTGLSHVFSSRISNLSKEESLSDYVALTSTLFDGAYYLMNDETYIVLLNKIFNKASLSYRVEKHPEYIKYNVIRYFEENSAVLLDIMDYLIEREIYTSRPWVKRKIEVSDIAVHAEDFDDQDKYNKLVDGIIYSASQKDVLIDFYDDIENITSILIQNIDNNLINQNFFRKELKDLIRK